MCRRIACTRHILFWDRLSVFVVLCRQNELVGRGPQMLRVGVGYTGGGSFVRLWPGESPIRVRPQDRHWAQTAKRAGLDVLWQSSITSTDPLTSTFAVNSHLTYDAQGRPITITVRDHDHS